MSRFTFTTSIERDDDEIDVRVTYTVTPFVAATYWQPAEGGEVEIETAEFIGVDAASMPAPLTDAELDELAEQAGARCRDDMADAAADLAAYRYEQYRDRVLMDRWEQGA